MLEVCIARAVMLKIYIFIDPEEELAKSAEKTKLFIIVKLRLDQGNDISHNIMPCMERRAYHWP